MKIGHALKQVQTLAIETAPLIYFIENHPTYADTMRSLTQLIERDELRIVVSALTITELLAKPLTSKNTMLIHGYMEFLFQTEYLEIEPVTNEIAFRAARMRGTYNLKTPDAIHLASAVETRCDAFLTNDNIFRRFTEIPVLLLDDLESDPPEQL